MDTLVNFYSSAFGTTSGLAGFICGVALIYLVIARTLKRREDPEA